MKRKLKYIFLCLIMIFITISSASAEIAIPSVIAPISVDASEEESGELLQMPVSRTEDAALAEMELAAENQKFQLFIDTRYLTIALRTKATGQILFSNPVSIPKSMPTSEENKSDIFSQLQLTYYNKNFERKSLISWTDCVTKGQYRIESVDNGVEVVMTLGEASSRIMVPMVITEEAFDALLAKIPKENQAKIIRSYKYYNLEKAVNDNQRKEWLKLFPVLANQSIYALKGNASMREKKDMEVFFKKAGLTFEDVDYQHQLLDYVAEDDFLPSFKVPVRFILDEGGLECSIDAAGIEFDKEQFYLYDITLLKYFGAGFINDAEGYMMVPDGSGALVRYTGLIQKGTTRLSMKIFGTDISGEEESIFIPRQTGITLPVFGNRNIAGSFIAAVEDGSAMGYVNAQIGNNANPMNAAYVSFIYTNNISYVFDEYNFDQNVTLFSKENYKGKYSVLYMPVSGQDSGYVGMAQTYRQHLEDNGGLPEEKPGNDKSLYLKLLGSIQTDERFLGFPITQNTALTSFEAAAAFLESLKSKGVGSFVVQYKGWANGGLNHTAFNRIDIERSLGGKQGFDELTARSDELDARMFFDTDFQFVSRDTLFDGFSAKRDSSRNLLKNIVGYSPLNYATSKYNSKIFTTSISPAQYGRFFDALLRAFGKLSYTNISLSNAGRFLYSDYRAKAVINTQAALGKMQETLERIPQNFTTLFENGNSYVLPYADYIMDLPMNSNRHILEDEDVPFVQMVISGRIHYSSGPANLASNSRDELLRSIETGSALCYVLAVENYQKLKNTNYSDYYSVDAGSQKDGIVSLYKEFITALGDSAGTRITGHRILGPGVRETTYENGRIVVVNYNDFSAEADGITVAAKGFIVR